MNLKEDLLNLIRTLNAAQLQYAVCGGLAMTIHGFVRSTVDIDLLVPEDQSQQVLKTVETAGFWIPSGRMPFKTKTPMAMDIYRVSRFLIDITFAPRSSPSHWKTDTIGNRPLPFAPWTDSQAHDPRVERPKIAPAGLLMFSALPPRSRLICAVFDRV